MFSLNNIDYFIILIELSTCQSIFTEQNYLLQVQTHLVTKATLNPSLAFPWKGSNVVPGQLSPANNWKHWNVRSVARNIQTCTHEKSWPRRRSSRKRECKSGSLTEELDWGNNWTRSNSTLSTPCPCSLPSPFSNITRRLPSTSHLGPNKVTPRRLWQDLVLHFQQVLFPYPAPTVPAPRAALLLRRTLCTIHTTVVLAWSRMEFSMEVTSSATTWRKYRPTNTECLHNRVPFGHAMHRTTKWLRIWRRLGTKIIGKL